MEQDAAAVLLLLLCQLLHLHPAVEAALNQNGFNIEGKRALFCLLGVQPSLVCVSPVSALFAFKQSLVDPQNAMSGWDKNAVDPCSWIHVSCSEQNVSRVELPGLQLSGQLSPRLADLANLQYLMLQNNNLSGPIPPEFGNWSRIISVDLSNNNLSDPIPSTLGKLQTLQYLRLNNNSLSGAFPVSVATIRALDFLDVSFNNLSGNVPNATTANLNVKGNPLLCGSKTSRICPGDPPRHLEPLSQRVGSGGSASRGALASGLAVAAFLLASLLAFGAVWWKRHHNRQVFFDVNEQQDPEVALGQLKKFSFRELQTATDNFDMKNILGRGGFGIVYKGTLPDGTPIAVKRLKEGSSNGGEYQFQMEVEMISLAVHRNLLRLKGFCMTPTERLLVYPYMPNGSVASRLRDLICGKPALDWPTRKRIALGSARGLLYLHEHCDPKIIHRDVKAANILLDEDFEAVVGDFGLAKLLDHRESHVTTAVRGTVGHIAPEYLSTGQSSEKTDVFGFGILLLELITGQGAFDFNRLLTNKDVMLLDWWLQQVKQLQHANNLDRLVDAELKGNYNAVELEEMVQVALLCTQMFPADRPKMSEVVRMLEGDGLAERWEEWQKVETRRSREAQLIPRRYYELVEDSNSDLEAVDLSGPR
ncbi:hypothetical protein SELMODRAFT_172211 [Selaginella moellendorffii]|uniref:non-specific serine/threonine protein kinase n=1 Tax=Selaginella moellendorffii TaxID=88036 RepID=D8RKF6_SELML|nr:hypothetical protein SELMODRAFT_172211 [Selaginella moellendorffii]